MANVWPMDPATTATTRAVVTGLLLSVLSAGSLVAFSVVARHTEDPVTIPVVPHQPAAVAAPVVIEGPRRESPDGSRVGIRIAPDRDAGERTTAIVLGTRVRNNDQDKKKEPRASDASVTTHAPDHSSRGHHSNGNAYGHYKGKAHGSAVGHSNSHGPPAKPSKKK